MKNFGLTLLLMLFVGVGTSMAQDKKVAADSDAAAVKTEMSVKEHHCSADCTKACCAKKDGREAASTKACAPGCEKKCCTADAGKATKEEHDHSKHDHPHKK